MVSKLFSFLGSILDQHLFHKKIPSFIATRFFDFFSRITNFVFFNDIAFVLLLLYIVYSMHTNHSELHVFFLGKTTFQQLTFNTQFF